MSDHLEKIGPSDAGSAALVGGFLLLIGVLYGRNPAVAIDAATASVGATVYFVVLPVLGVLAGIYAYAGGPHGGLPLFAFGSYLGVFGVGVAFGTLVAASTSPVLLAAGFALVALGVVAVVTSVLRLVGAVGIGLPGGTPE
mgnify:FL=1